MQAVFTSAAMKSLFPAPGQAILHLFWEAVKGALCPRVVDSHDERWQFRLLGWSVGE
jgi:hypothetical protein